MGNLPQLMDLGANYRIFHANLHTKKWDHRGISEKGRVIAGNYHAQRMDRTGAPAAVRPSVNGSIRVSTLQIGAQKKKKGPPLTSQEGLRGHWRRWWGTP